MRIAVTGHQPHLLGGFGAEAAGLLEGFAVRALEARAAAHGRPAVVVSGMAPGWDLAMAKAALRLGVPLRAVLAHPKQGNNWPEDARAELAGLLAAAERVDVMGAEGGPAAAPGLDKWTARDLHVIEGADLLVALWNGSDGGTARAVAMARDKGLPISNLWGDWLALHPEPRNVLG
jgi:hypothetical protein